MAAPVLEIIIRAKDQATRVIDEIGNKVSSNADKILNGMERAGRTLSVAVTAPIVGAGAAALKLQSDWEMTMAHIVGLTDTPQAQLDEWKGKVLDLSREYGVSANSIAEALYFIAGAGLTGQTAIDALTASVQAQTAGLGDAQVIADLLTSVINAYGAENITSARAVDILTAAVNYGKAEADAFAPVMGRLVPTASAMGISFEQVAGILAVFSRTGLDAAEGATSLQAVMSTLLKPSKEASDTLSEAGLSMAKLREMAQGPNGVVNVMRLLGTTFADDDEKLAAIIPNVRAFRGFMNVLAQDGKTVDEVLQGVTDSTGALDKAVGAVTETNAFKVQKSWNQVKLALQSFGAVILPVFATGAQAIGLFAEAMERLPRGSKQVVAVFLAIIAAIGPTLLITAKFIKAWREINQVMSIGSAVTNPWVLALVAIAVAAYLIYKNWDKIKAFLIQAWAEISRAASVAWQAVRDATVTAWNAILAFFKQWWPLLLVPMTGGLSLVVGLVIRNWDKIKGFTVNAWNAILSFLKQWWPVLFAVMTGGLSLIVGLIIRNWDTIASATSDAWNFIAGIVQTYLSIVTGVIQFGMGLVQQVMSTAWSIVVGVVQNAWGQIHGAIQFGVNVANFIVGGINVVADIFRSVFGAVISIVNGAAQFIFGTVGRIKDALASIPSSIPGVGLVGKGLDAVGLRALGGAVARAKPYIVGEKGPELFIPDENGTVIPAGLTQTMLGRMNAAHNAMQSQQLSARVPTITIHRAPQPAPVGAFGAGGPPQLPPIDVSLTLDGTTVARILVDPIRGELAKKGSRGARTSLDGA